MKVAIMQPYLFPYIGYFQLLNFVDVFVFYDDVNFIKKGWINRNRLLVKGEASLFTVPLKKASQNNLICKQKLALDEKWKSTFLTTIELNYKKAKNFEEVFEFIRQFFRQDFDTISDLASVSVLEVAKYLGIDTEIKFSSVDYADTKGFNRADRLIEITKKMGADEYINPIGGQQLYSHSYFEMKGLILKFMESDLRSYGQFNHSFVEGLSVLDVMMFNDREQIIRMLQDYSLT